MLLGKGAYGQVRKDGNYAIKTFSKLSHLVQEFVAGFYLRDCRGIIRVHEAHFDKLELKMDYYEMNLRKFIEEGKGSTEDKMSILYDMLCGLAQMHRRGIVHGDIKPGNTLISRGAASSSTAASESKSKSRVSAFIGDLGFVSLANYSKVTRTTAVYRDKVIVQGPSHDLFSLGIVILELFGELRVNRQPNHDEIEAVAKKYLTDKKIRQLVIDLTQPKWEARPSAHHILESLFGEDPTLAEKVPPNFSIASGSEAETIQKWMRHISKSYEIKRAKRGYYCLMHFLATHKIVSATKYKLCTAVILVILSSIFGKSGFKERAALKWCKKSSKEDFLEALATMLNDRDVIYGLLSA